VAPTDRCHSDGTDFNNADLVSAKLIRPVGLDAAKNFDKAKNVERVQRDE